MKLLFHEGIKNGKGLMNRKFTADNRLHTNTISKKVANSFKVTRTLLLPGLRFTKTWLTYDIGEMTKVKGHRKDIGGTIEWTNNG